MKGIRVFPVVFVVLAMVYASQSVGAADLTYLVSTMGREGAGTA